MKILLPDGLMRFPNRDAHDIDMRRQRFILTFVSVAACVLMFFYAMTTQRPLLAGLLFLCALAFLVNIVLFYIYAGLARANQCTSILTGIAVIGLVLQGAAGGSALYWIFTFPVILYGLLDARAGLFANIGLALILGVLFCWPLTLADYPAAHKQHVMLALGIIIVIGWLNEFGRERSYRLMTELQHIKETQAHTDALTELANRRFIDSVLPRILHEQRENYFPLAVIACDLDHFKQVNDKYGHAVGDQALKHVARLFKSRLRQGDIPCRAGGEEFLLLLPRCEKLAAIRVAEILRSLLEETPLPLASGEGQLAMTASFGVSVCLETDGLHDAFKQADQALYVAKDAGRNQVA